MYELFEIAARKKLRFTTPRGAVSIEELWDLPLIDARNPSLDAIAIDLNTQIQASSVSFVDEKPTNHDLAIKLDIVKHIIATKKHEAEMAKGQATLRQQSHAIREELVRRQTQSILDLSEDQLRERLAAIERGEDPDAVKPAPAAQQTETQSA